VNYRFAVWTAIVLAPAIVRAAEPAPSNFTVEGAERHALICAPTATDSSAASPLVFVFHGRGGSMHKIARSMHLQTEWPEAIVVYMQGLPIQSKIDPEGKQAGWQHYSGQLDDRDLKFFDAVLASLHKSDHVDDRRIYATGFSNGGAFTYCLCANRPGIFAAFAPMAGLPWPTELPHTPKPAFIVAGEADNLVPIQSQQSLIGRIRELDAATASNPQPRDDGTTLYESSIGDPVVTLIHPGGHMLPSAAPRLIADFFRTHPRIQ
jgi:polyhydroxybutyrate depolymerase